MAGRNAVNKPKIKMLAQSHAKSLGRKRASRNSIQTRSSTSRYALRGTTAPRPTDSRAIALFTGETPNPVSKMTTNTLSNKRAKKIARNQKYLTQKQEEDIMMKVDNEIKQTNLDKVKKTLWDLIERNKTNGPLVLPDAEGTTLGVQSF
ncbi:ALB1 [Candida pseudojiufengensis]|uniref:ALB1 n=1 Tax=Candida pseudojiufengensis TaxID=497109 RepID=UPI0022247D6A|nr:ALB1 [Candida pseudojiufengensis]KAI5960844.1 ALB1 [Candida pseudojiufengensis]